MQRAVQRDDRATHQRAKRLSRALVCAAAVPAVFITAGCSSGSGDSAPKDKGAASQGAASGRPSASASASVQAAAYAKLPEPCGVLTGKTLGDLVPEGAKSGKKGGTDDTTSRSSCSWTSLDNNGVKGSQFRWLNVSLLRFDSDASRGTGDKQAHAYYTRQVSDAQGVSGAKNTKSQPVAGTGDEATEVRYDLKKKEGSFKEQTVVARAHNIVVTVDYNGAGLAGDKTPDADDLAKAAQSAAKEAVASVLAANGQGQAPGSSSSSPSDKPSDKSAGKDSGKDGGKDSSASPSPAKSGDKKATSSAKDDKKD